MDGTNYRVNSQSATQNANGSCCPRKIKDITIVLIKTVTMALIAIGVASFFYGLDGSYLDASKTASKKCSTGETRGCSENATNAQNETWLNFICPRDPPDELDGIEFANWVVSVYIVVMVCLFVGICVHDIPLAWQAHKSGQAIPKYGESGCASCRLGYLSGAIYSASFYTLGMLGAVIGVIAADTLGRHHYRDFSHDCDCTCKWPLSDWNKAKAIFYSSLAFILCILLWIRLCSLKKIYNDGTGRQALFSLSYGLPVETVLAMTDNIDENGITTTYFDK